MLNQIVACFDYDVVFVAEDGGDLVRDPLLHQVNVDLLNVDFLIELRWEFSRLKALLIDAEGHVDSSVRRLSGVYSIEDAAVHVKAGMKGKRTELQLAARLVGI